MALALGASVARELPRGTLLGEWELPAGVFVMGRVPKIDFEHTASGTKLLRLRRLRLALLSSAVFGVIAAGVYLAWRRL